MRPWPSGTAAAHCQGRPQDCEDQYHSFIILQRSYGIDPHSLVAICVEHDG
jgi:hypothetical protein